MSGASSGWTGTLGVFGATLFMSACLAFMVQPMVAKMLMPLLGGAPMVWNTCLVFFQTMLLAGYAYAHLVTRIRPAAAGLAAHSLLLLCPLIVLPLRLTDAPGAGVENPLSWTVVTLARTVGVPFFVLTASTSLLQAWFSRIGHPRASKPYFLYAASNSGSLFGLLAYPTVVERLLPTAQQARVWAGGYIVFAAFAIACAALTWQGRSPAGAADRTSNPHQSSAPATRTRITWLLLAFIPSSLLLGTTTYLTTDIASVPLLWVAPLSIYLLTFIVAFGASARGWDTLAAETLPLIVAVGATFMTPYAAMPVVAAIGLHLCLLASASLMCHGYLARLTPDPSHLTAFYLWVAAGGVLGGLFNVLVAPVLFESVVEYPLMIVAACALAALRPRRMAPRLLEWPDGAWPAGVFALTLAGTLAVREFSLPGAWIVAALAGPAVVAFSQSARPVRFALCIGALLLASSATSTAYGDVLHQERTFFGVYRVSQRPAQEIRLLYSGTTLHGAQSLGTGRDTDPLFYYARSGPVGQLFEALPHLREAPHVGVIGLGVGALSVYAGTSQTWTFFEIDPAVERLARQHFTFLSRCGPRCDVVLGDARVSLGQVEPGRYSLLLIDAFSSDAIPVHLLTREAVSLYLSRLAPGGVLAFHLSNRHLALAPVVGRIAQELDATVLRQVMDTPDAASTFGQAGYEWLVLTRDSADLAPVASTGRWHAPPVRPGTPLWTDDYSNIISVLR